jgi:hypothetical protein
MKMTKPDTKLVMQLILLVIKASLFKRKKEVEIWHGRRKMEL